jgi:hypothetical protein
MIVQVDQLASEPKIRRERDRLRQRALGGLATGDGRCYDEIRQRLTPYVESTEARGDLKPKETPGGDRGV